MSLVRRVHKKRSRPRIERSVSNDADLPPSKGTVALEPLRARRLPNPRSKCRPIAATLILLGCGAHDPFSPSIVGQPEVSSTGDESPLSRRPRSFLPAPEEHHSFVGDSSLDAIERVFDPDRVATPGIRARPDARAPRARRTAVARRDHIHVRPAPTRFAHFSRADGRTLTTTSRLRQPLMWRKQCRQRMPSIACSPGARP